MGTHLAVHLQHSSFGVAALRELHEAAALARWDLDIYNITEWYKNGAELLLSDLQDQSRSGLKEMHHAMSLSLT